MILRIVIFGIGVAAGLAISKRPRYAIFRDNPPTPAEWKPRFRRWINGIEIEGRSW